MRIKKTAVIRATAGPKTVLGQAGNLKNFVGLF